MSNIETRRVLIEKWDNLIELRKKLVELNFFTIRHENIQKPIKNIEGFYLISYIKDINGYPVTVEVGQTVILNGTKLKITEIAYQNDINYKMKISALGWKHWIKFNKEFPLNCHIANS